MSQLTHALELVGQSLSQFHFRFLVLRRPVPLDIVLQHLTTSLCMGWCDVRRIEGRQSTQAACFQALIFSFASPSRLRPRAAW